MGVKDDGHNFIYVKVIDNMIWSCEIFYCSALIINNFMRKKIIIYSLYDFY